MDGCIALTLSFFCCVYGHHLSAEVPLYDIYMDCHGAFGMFS